MRSILEKLLNLYFLFFVLSIQKKNSSTFLMLMKMLMFFLKAALQFQIIIKIITIITIINMKSFLDKEVLMFNVRAI